MSRYTCYECKAEHGTENMSAFCASCFYLIKNQMNQLIAENLRLKKKI